MAMLEMAFYFNAGQHLDVRQWLDNSLAVHTIYSVAEKKLSKSSQEKNCGGIHLQTLSLSKELIQSGKIEINRVASLSFISFRYLSVLVEDCLKSEIYIYPFIHHCAVSYISYNFLFDCQWGRILVWWKQKSRNLAY